MRIALIAVVALTLVLAGFAFGLALQQQPSLSTQDPDPATAPKTQEEEQARPPGIEAKSWKLLSPECGLVIDETGSERTLKGRLMARIAGGWVEVYLSPGPAEVVHIR